jgi:hypothetical protein
VYFVEIRSEDGIALAGSMGRSRYGKIHEGMQYFLSENMFTLRCRVILALRPREDFAHACNA